MRAPKGTAEDESKYKTQYDEHATGINIFEPNIYSLFFASTLFTFLSTENESMHLHHSNPSLLSKGKNKKPQIRIYTTPCHLNHATIFTLTS